MRPTHARGKQSGRSLVEAKADCVTERDIASRRFRLLAASTLTSLVSYGVVRLRISPNELHSRTSFPFCLELLLLPLFYELDLSFSHLSMSVVTESPIHTQPENSAADRQIHDHCHYQQ